MTDSERLAEGLLIFLKRPGPTPVDFARWETILGAHHMHIRVLTDLARKILNDRDTAEESNSTGPVPPNGALVPGITPTWEASRPPLHDNSPAEGALRSVEPGGNVDGSNGRGGHGWAFGNGTQAELPYYSYGGPASTD